jgi:hypothetical protein
MLFAGGRLSRWLIFGRDVELEEGHPLVHRFGLVFERLGGGGILLDQRRVLLCHFVHLCQRLVDLFDAARLFIAGIGDIGDDIGHLLD